MGKYFKEISGSWIFDTFYLSSQSTRLLHQNRGQSTRNDNKYRNIRSASRQQRKNINWEILIIESFYVYKGLN